MPQTQDLQRLVVSLEARLDKFNRDMNRAAGITDKTTKRIEDRFARMERKMATVGRNIRSIFGGIGAAAVLRSFGQAVDKIANIGEIAGRIGVTTRALQAMYAISKRTGASLEEMDRALQAIGEQSAEAGSFLHKLFAANDRPVSSNVEENLRTVMDLLKDAANEQERLSIATKLFGDRLGRGLVEAFSKGGAEIDRVFDELLAKGQAHSEAQIKEAEKIRNSYRQYMDDISLYWQKTVVAMLESTGLFTDKSAEELNELIAAGKAQLTTLLATRDRIILEGQGWFDKSLLQLNIEIAAAEANLRRLRALLTTATAPAALKKLLTGPLAVTTTSTGTTVMPVDPVDPGPGREAIELDDAMKRLIEDMDDARDSAKGFASDLRSGLREGLTLTEALGQAFSNLADRMIDKLLDQAVDALMGPAGTAGTGIIGQLLGISLKSQDRLTPGAPEMPGGTVPLIPVVGKILSSIAKPAIDDGWKEVAREVLPPEVDLTAGAADAAGMGLGTAVPVIPVIQSLLKSIARHPSYEQVPTGTPDPFELFKLFQGLLGGGGFLGSFGGARAAGGPIDPGLVYKVHKDELVMPRVPSLVIPKHQANGGGVETIVHIDKSKYFDAYVEQRAANHGNRAVNTARRGYPAVAARHANLGTT